MLFCYLFILLIPCGIILANKILLRNYLFPGLGSRGQKALKKFGVWCDVEVVSTAVVGRKDWAPGEYLILSFAAHIVIHRKIHLFVNH